MIVADASIIVPLFVGEGEPAAWAEQVRAHDREWAVPPLWESEFRNALWKYIRAGWLDLSTAIEAVERADALLGDRVFPVGSAAVLMLAVNSGCTAYDCEYVALAQTLGVKLVTVDRQVLTAFPDLAVHPKDFGTQEAE